MENHIEVEETKHNKGFTLVELLIVIVILGILATVTVFAVTGITNKGKTSACQSDLKVIQTAEEAYNANTGSYTNDQAILKTAGLIHHDVAELQHRRDGHRGDGDLRPDGHGQRQLGLHRHQRLIQRLRKTAGAGPSGPAPSFFAQVYAGASAVLCPGGRPIIAT